MARIINNIPDVDLSELLGLDVSKELGVDTNTTAPGDDGGCFVNDAYCPGKDATCIWNDKGCGPQQ